MRPGSAPKPSIFVRDVRPILQKHCYECHGDKKQKSGLRLDVKQAAFQGGDGYGEVSFQLDAAQPGYVRVDNLLLKRLLARLRRRVAISC